MPRLGPVLVARIIEERERKPFRSLDDFDARVRGIGPVTASGLRPFLDFGPKFSIAADSLATRVPSR